VGILGFVITTCDFCGFFCDLFDDLFGGEVLQHLAPVVLPLILHLFYLTNFVRVVLALEQLSESFEGLNDVILLRFLEV